MKKLFLSSACLLFAMAMSAQSIFVGTYNIRYRNDGDEKKGNVWATRCKVICDMINFEAPDVFGTQEVLIPYSQNGQFGRPWSPSLASSQPS